MTTNPLPPARVEQVDRLGAAKFTSQEWSPVDGASVKVGAFDTHLLVQAFARHRQAGIAEGLERAAKVAESCNAFFGANDTPLYAACAARKAVVNAIRTLSDEGAAS